MEFGSDLPLQSISSRSLMVDITFGGTSARQWKVDAAWHGMAFYGSTRQAPWGAMPGRGGVVVSEWRALKTHDEAFRVAWADFLGRRESVASSPYVSAPRSATSSLPAAWGELSSHSISRSALWCSLVSRGAYVALPWGPIGARQSGIHIDWPVEPDPSTGPITVPRLPVYVMIPTLSAVLLPDRTPLPLLGISLTADSGSWAWSFSAPMAHAGLSLVDVSSGAAPEIEVAINGFVWTFRVEGFDDNRRFGSKTVTLRGRSRSAELAEPHAPRRTFTEPNDRTAAQLADAEVLNTGWTLLWDAPDWLVPGGTFGYQDLAPIDAIARLASAIGAAVHSDAASKVLTVAPSYPVSPWAWDAATPYAIVPASILTQGDGSWQGGVNADGVYVYAETQASGALVKITGSAGAQQLPMIVERLAVHADAQRERGRTELSAAGVKRRITRTVPLFPSPAPEGQPDLGVIPVGSLLEVEDTDETWRGQVMSVRIDAQRAGSALSVRQHLTIERQYR